MSSGYRVIRVITNVAARVRLYATEAARDADVARTTLVDPEGNHGCVLEVVTTPALLDLFLSPVPQGYVFATDQDQVPWRIENLGGSTAPVNVTLYWQPQEAGYPV